MHVAASWAENVKNVNRIHLHVVHVTALAPKIKESWRFFSIKHRIVPFAKCPHCRQRCMPSLQSCRTRRQWICPQPCTSCPRSKEELNPMKHTRNTARFVLSLWTNDLTTPSMLFYSTQRQHITFFHFPCTSTNALLNFSSPPISRPLSAAKRRCLGGFSTFKGPSKSFASL